MTSHIISNKNRLGNKNLPSEGHPKISGQPYEALAKYCVSSVTILEFPRKLTVKRYIKTQNR